MTPLLNEKVHDGAHAHRLRLDAARPYDEAVGRTEPPGASRSDAGRSHMLRDGLWLGACVVSLLAYVCFSDAVSHFVREVTRLTLKSFTGT